MFRKLSTLTDDDEVPLTGGEPAETVTGPVVA